MNETVKNVIFWQKQKIFRRKAYRRYKSCLENDRIEEKKLKLINWEKRKKIVEFAYEQIPFYNLKYRSSDFHPSMLNTEEDWQKIPILHKNEIRENTSSLRLPYLKDRYFLQTTTGGSTGEPLKVYRDKRFNEEILQWRMLHRWKISPGIDRAMLWRIPSRYDSFFASIKNQVIWWPTKRIKLDASFISAKDLQEIVKKIKEHKIKLIWGYVGALEKLGVYLEKKNESLPFIELIWATAAPITKIQRNLFKKTMTGRIINQYACSEVHWIASNCPYNEGLHVDNDFRHVDIIDNANHPIFEANKVGSILITDLENHAFPLIRYRVGDRSSWVGTSCSCGRPHPLIHPVQGRESDMLVTPDGDSLNGEFLTTVFDAYTDEIKKFQFHQISDFSVHVKVVPKGEVEMAEQVVQKVIAELYEKTKGKLNFHIRISEDISDERGKIRFIKSDIEKK